MRSAIIAVVLVAFCACKKPEQAEVPVSAPEPVTPPAEAARPEPIVPPAALPAPDQVEKKPLALSEQKLTKYIGYHKELAVAVKKALADSKLLNPKHPKDQPQGLSAVAAAAQTTSRIEKQTEALRQKYGLTEEEDKLISEAVGEVTAASLESNPLMAPAFVELRKQAQAAKGPEKEAAEKVLKEMEQKNKEELAMAEAKFGAEAVKLLSKHVKELAELQVDMIKTALGGAK